MIQILPLGGGQDVGRSCIIVTMGGKTIMFDCGMHMGYNDERRFPDFTALSASKQFDRVIDLVIISHFHLDHCGGLPYFTEMCGYNGPIIMTHPTRDICPILLEDFRKITVDRRGEQNFFTSAMIQNCMKKVTCIDLSQEIFLDNDSIRVKAYYAGHVLGAAMFHVQVGDESVLYTGDYNMTADRHLGGAIIDRCEPDVLITESTYAATIRDSKRARERDFLKQVHLCVANGGKVLVPTFALGRVQELCILIDAYWTKSGLGDIPVYFTGGMAAMATKYYRHWINWTNEAILTSFTGKDGNVPKSPDSDPAGNGTNPFDFANIRPFEKSYADLPGPMVVFSTPGMLHSGTSLELFKKWCSDPRNMLIIPGYCVAGTVGAKVLAGQKTIEVQEVRVRGTNMTSTTVELAVNLQVKNLSFSAHVDAKGILQLISQCRPKNVVLVHGEGSKMSILKEKIISTFHCPVYYPSNGEVLFIETMAWAAKSIALSRSFFEKRKRDIREAAQEVSYSEHLSERAKMDMLMKSIKIQDRPDLIEFDGYLNWTLQEHGSGSEREAEHKDGNQNDIIGASNTSNLTDMVSLLSAWELSAVVNDQSVNEQVLYSLTLLKNNVRRYFLKKKLQSLAALSQRATNADSNDNNQNYLTLTRVVDYVSILQVLLMKTFHPQICVKLEIASASSSSSLSSSPDYPEQGRLLVHSVQLTADPEVGRIPLAIVENVKEITPEHVEYSLRWSSAGEKIAKAIIQIIQDELE